MQRNELTQDQLNAISKFAEIEAETSRNNDSSRYDALIKSLKTADLYMVAVYFLQNHVNDKNALNPIRQRYMTNMMYRSLANRLEYDPLSETSSSGKSAGMDDESHNQMDNLNWFIHKASINNQAAIDCILFTRIEVVRQTLEAMLSLKEDDIHTAFKQKFPGIGDDQVKSMVGQLIAGAQNEKLADFIFNSVAEGIVDQLRNPAVEAAILNDKVTDKHPPIIVPEEKAKLAVQEGKDRVEKKAQLARMGRQKGSAGSFFKAMEEAATPEKRLKSDKRFKKSKEKQKGSHIVRKGSSGNG